jgi:1-deoxy-D-xylulose-5-phosphate reductoisomerase
LSKVKRKVAILGSTGSIGVQALEVIAQNPDEFEVVALAAGGASERSKSLFREQCDQFLGLNNHNNTALSAEDGFESVVKLADTNSTGADVVLNGIAGVVGLEPSIRALESGGKLALANKESIVVGGSVITKLVGGGDEMLTRIHPVDSEHSAIWQCIQGEVEDWHDAKRKVRKLILTASGGPFRGMTRSELVGVTVEQALKHPTWDMGPLVTINSATLMNKALELIEAHYLFNIEPANIEVTVHPQSIIHSMVEYIDGATIAQKSPPSMKLPIALALSYPQRIDSIEPALDWNQTYDLHFEPVDNDIFPALNIARECLAAGPLFPVVMNAANEIAVNNFIRGAIGFLDIIDSVRAALDTFEPNTFSANPTAPTLAEIKNLLEHFTNMSNRQV